MRTGSAVLEGERREGHERDAPAVTEFIDRVHFAKEAVMMERNGIPPLPEMTAEETQRVQAQEGRAWEIIEQVRARNAELSPEDVLAEVTTEVEAVRRERYERRHSTRPSGH
jgi:hypothetical protein